MKLLRRTIQNYILFSALLFVLCTPIFYLAIQRLFVHEMDGVLLSHKKDFIKSSQYLKTEDDLVLYHMMNKEFILTPAVSLMARDTLFTEDKYDSLHGGIIPFRTYKSGVLVQGKSYLLTIKESMVSSRDLVAAIVGIQAGLLLFLFLGLVLINRKLTRIIWDPFYTILDRLKRYQIDKDASIDLPTSSTAEFRDLSSAIAQLISNNRNAYQSQKEFTENASHEIQTPLALLNGKLDLLIQTDLTEQQADLIGNIHSSALRISRLNRNLLLLTKIENHQFQTLEEIDGSHTLTHLITQFEESIHAKNLLVTYSFPDGKIMIKSNKALLEILLSNLLSNAIRYAPVNTRITLEGSRKSIKIRNEGERLKRPEVVFERFTREDTNSNGTGLGLAIAKKIVDQLGYTLHYRYEESHHIFEIIFNPVPSSLADS
jgi:signal transduction histidine kinase